MHNRKSLKLQKLNCPVWFWFIHFILLQVGAWAWMRKNTLSKYNAKQSCLSALKEKTPHTSVSDNRPQTSVTFSVLHQSQSLGAYENWFLWQFLSDPNCLPSANITGHKNLGRAPKLYGQNVYMGVTYDCYGTCPRKLHLLTGHTPSVMG